MFDKQLLIETLQDALAVAREGLSGKSATNNSEIYWDYLCACSQLEEALRRIENGEDSDC